MMNSVVPTIKDSQDLEQLLRSSLEGPLLPLPTPGANDSSEIQGFVREAAPLMLERRGGEVGCKEALRLLERAVLPQAFRRTSGGAFVAASALEALDVMLQDLRSDEQMSAGLCEVVLQ